MKMNLGCGPDIKDGWVNVDGSVWPQAELWDATTPPPPQYQNKFDHILINHTLCLLSYDDVETALKNVYECLEDFGVIEIIDMDPIKSFRSFEEGDVRAFPGFEGSIDSRLCHHLVGYGRKSLWTPNSMIEALTKVGFKDAEDCGESVHDLRPIESFIVKARK